MKLHKDTEVFEELSQLVSEWRNIPVEAVKRDYLIVMVLKKLSKSEYVDLCVFKGGTSLSKCYPETIERFSEDVDLTFLDIDLSEKKRDKIIKKIEEILWEGMVYKKINSERSKISKSSHVWLEELGEDKSIKLEIGSTVRPEPYKKMILKTYIQEYLEENNFQDELEKYELEEIEVNVLDITRTFLDKVLAVKRHAYNNDLLRKVRHIYDVVKLYESKEIQEFLVKKEELESLLEITKKTDLYYIEKRRNHVENYSPEENYQFDKWLKLFDTEEIKKVYENLQEDLLYTDEVQRFDRAIQVFKEINNILKEVEK